MSRSQDIAAGAGARKTIGEFFRDDLGDVRERLAIGRKIITQGDLEDLEEKEKLQVKIGTKSFTLAKSDDVNSDLIKAREINYFIDERMLEEVMMDTENGRINLETTGCLLIERLVRESFLTTAKWLLQEMLKYDFKSLSNADYKRIQYAADEKYYIGYINDAKNMVLAIGDITEALQLKHIQHNKITKDKFPSKIAKLTQIKAEGARDIDDVARIFELKARISDGTIVKKGNSIFKILKEDREEKKEKDLVFLQKNNSVESKLGSDIFRLLSRGRYVGKRELLEPDERGIAGVHTLVKFDEKLGRTFLSQIDGTTPIFDINNPKNHVFLRQYARMCGVIQVLGEADPNPNNFLTSEKNGKPVKIDNGFFVNFLSHCLRAYEMGDQRRYRAYGSAQSQGFLQNVLGGSTVFSSYKSKMDRIDEAYEAHIKSGNDLEKYAKEGFTDAFNENIDGELFAKIKERISKPENKHLQDAFMEFMSGVNDAIILSQDSGFFSLVIATYNSDVGRIAGSFAAKSVEFYRQNAQEAAVQFKEYLQYFKRLRSKNTEYQTTYSDMPRLNSIAASREEETTSATETDGVVVSIDDEAGTQVARSAATRFADFICCRPRL